MERSCEFSTAICNKDECDYCVLIEINEYREKALKDLAEPISTMEGKEE